MANMYGYQYDTNPRKLETPYSKPKRKSVNTKKTQPKANANNQKKNDTKMQKLNILRIKFSIGLKTILIIAAFFFILFREAQMNELFSQIQKLKASVTTIQKENDQIEISIQNSINANNIEQAAKEQLGMQKLSPKQTVYISLPKEDYVEHRTEEVIIEEEKTPIKEFFDNIKNIVSKK